MPPASHPLSESEILASLLYRDAMMLVLNKPPGLATQGGSKTFEHVDDLLDAIRDGAVLRVRPKAMTVAVILAGLLPIMWGAGTGSEVMQRIAAPMVGGMITAPLLSMFVIPAAYLLIRRSKKARRATQAPHMKHA